MPTSKLSLDSAKSIVKQYVAGWTDQKLAEVMAFCEDGRMNYDNTCCCLIGVSSADNLHRANIAKPYTGEPACMDGHYFRLKFGTKHTAQSWAETAYLFLGGVENLQSTRDRHFLEILHTIMEEREAAHALPPVEELCAV